MPSTEALPGYIACVCVSVCVCVRACVLMCVRIFAVATCSIMKCFLSGRITCVMLRNSLMFSLDLTRGRQLTWVSVWVYQEVVHLY